MENNLYYQPTIEEFHVGFEYLAKVDNQLINQTYNNIPLETIYKGIEDGWVVVKTLDQSDIESLGWESTKDENNIQCFKLKNDFLYWFNNTTISISRVKINYQIFRGTIKNKSELIKLMQQLNIK